MASSHREGTVPGAANQSRYAIGAILAFATLLAINGAACAANAVLSVQDNTCLGCHGVAGLEKKLANGESLSLHVNGAAFAGSVHGPIGCATCHSDVNLKTHPTRAREINNTREYTVARMEICRTCHEDKFKQYEGSIHAALLRDGNPIAPVCTDCHSPHVVHAKAARESITEVPCRKCHSEIFDAYAGSVHGQARSKSDKSIAPICFDCHRAHDVTAASTSEQLKNACLGCHQDIVRAHQSWLPNATTHLQVISCAACHAPNAKRRVDLRLFDSVAQQRVREKEGVPQFETRARSADMKGVGLDALALQSLLKEFNRDGGAGKTILRGRLEVSTGVEAHQLTGKSKAIKDCATCHRQGAAAFEAVTVSIVGPDGRPLRYGAQQEVLNSVVSVDSVSGFYAIGGTRIKLLDWLLVLALVSGIAVPIGHQTLRWLFGLYAQKIRDQEAARHAREASQSSSVDSSSGGTPR